MPRLHIKLCDCSTLAIRFITWFEQSYMLQVINYFVRKILGRVLVFLVYGLLTFVAFVIGTIILPFEAQHKPRWMIYVLSVFAVYIILNIIYHYYNACQTPPGSPKRRNGVPFCYKCQNYKPQNAHHCAVCNTCVLHMDHHCIWINQCVGANNHRFFLQFIGFLTLGSLAFALVSWPSFYINFWAYSPSDSFCELDTLSGLPWRHKFCQHGSDFVSSSVFFCYTLSLVVFFSVGGLFWWNFSLISSGHTYIDFLQNGLDRGCLRQAIWPFDSKNFTANWKRFLGLRYNRSFWRHILLPSKHLTNFDEDDEITELTVI